MDSINYPSSSLQAADKFGWVYNPTNITEEIKNKAALAQEMLSSLSILTAEEQNLIAREIVISKAYADMFALDYIIEYMRLSLSVKGRGHEDTVKIVVGTTPKISVPTTMQKVRRILTGRGGKETGREEETMYQVGGDGEG